MRSEARLHSPVEGLDTLPPAAFADPAGGNREQVGVLLHGGVELVLSYLADASSRPPLPAGPTRIPDTRLVRDPAPLDDIVGDLSALLEGSMNPAHPGYIGHMDSVPTTMSLVGELVAAAVNNNLLSAEMSPTFTRLERALIAEFGRLFGLGDRAGGVLTSGGSLANLHALTVVRNRAFGAREEGMVSLPRQPVLFASETAHTSVHKAAMLLGLGTGAVVPVPSNDGGRMDPAALERAIAGAERHGQAPFCIVATAGTTVTGNIDPLPVLADIARANGLWLHVDAAYGGALVFSERERHRLAGIERADSITFNPQKWLYVAKTCAMAIFRDGGVLEEHFRIAAPYVRDEGGETNLGELGVQGTRHADVLKLWLSLRHLGTAGYERLIDRSYRLTARFVEHVRARPFLELASTPEMNLVCLRGVPDWIPPAEWDAWNAALQDHLLREADVFLSLPLYRGARWLRAVLLNPYTDELVLERLFGTMDAYATSSHPPG